VQIAMVTIDPARDTPAVLHAYLAHFFPAGHPLVTADQARLAAVAAGFGVQYDVTVDSSGEESVGHTALVYAVDRHGLIVDTWPFGVDSSVVTNDLRILLRRSTTA
jgi:protein SCO1/2